jgi:exonuclease III
MSAAGQPKAAHGPWARRSWVFRRICYQIATPGLAQAARDATIYKTTRFSDHAPLTIRYELPL